MPYTETINRRNYIKPTSPCQEEIQAYSQNSAIVARINRAHNLHSALIIIGENLHPTRRSFAGALRRKVIFLGQLMLQAADKGILMELMPLAEVNGQRISRGEVTLRLIQAY